MKDHCDECLIGKVRGFRCGSGVRSENRYISPQFQSRFVENDETLADELRSSSFIIGLCAGVMGVQHLMADGRRTISELFVPGDLILNSRIPEDADVIAMSDAEITYIPMQEFEKARQKEDNLDRIMLERLADQAQASSRHCVDIAKKTPPERLAAFIAEFRDRMMLSKADWQHLIRKIRRRDIADYLALEAETVSRSFTRLAEANVIKLHNGTSVEILNEKRLQKIAGGGWPRRRKNF